MPTPELIVEVEQDFTIYGEEMKFGGGKVIRDGVEPRGQTVDPFIPPLEQVPSTNPDSCMINGYIRFARKIGLPGQGKASKIQGKARCHGG